MFFYLNYFIRTISNDEASAGIGSKIIVFHKRPFDKKKAQKKYPLN